MLQSICAGLKEISDIPPECQEKSLLTISIAKGGFTMSVIHVAADTFQKEVLQSDKPVLVDFWAVWCGPCQMIGPVIEEIAAEKTDIKVCKVNVDEQMDLALEYGVSSIPTLMVFKDGAVISRQVGAIPKAEILAML